VKPLAPDDAGYWTPDPFFAGVSAIAAEYDLKIVHHALGPLDDEEGTPVAAILEMPPGYVLPRHAHQCERLEVIITGTLTVDGQELGPGTVLRSGASQFYGPHTAGPEGCTTVEVFAQLRGVGRVILADADSGSDQDPEGGEPTSFRAGPAAG
jgi:hypothetical protein